MNPTFRGLAATTVTSLLLLLNAAQAQTGEKPMLIDAKTRTATINRILQLLEAEYVFPETAQKMKAAVQARLAKKEYDSITDGAVLAGKLTSDLQAVSKDLHLRVAFSPQVQPQDSGKILEPAKSELEALHEQVARDNFGLEKTEILPGNIGYIKLNFFVSPEWSGEKITAAMNSVASTDALIFDLRDNGGSMSEQAIPFLTGYLFEKPTHINSLYWRHLGKATDYYSYADVPGTRYLNKPVYVLTSPRTFSGGEEFAYDLKNLKRATLVGGTTGGGANPGGSKRVNDYFAVWIPIGRAINPITKTNWEGVGVIPDVAVLPTQALNRAQLLALESLAKKATDKDTKAALTARITELKSAQPKLKKVTLRLKGYPNATAVNVSGTFNYWSPRGNPLKRRGDTWEGTVEVEPGRHMYKFIIDGEWITDPANPTTITDGPHTNSVLEVK